MRSFDAWKALSRGALALTMGGALLLTALPAHADPKADAKPPAKVAIIDMRRAVNETEDGLRVQALLTKIHDSRQVDLDQRQQKLQLDKDALEKKAQAGKTPQAQLQKDYENLQRAAAELQGAAVDYEREMQRQETARKMPIYQGVLDAVKTIAAQEGYDLVIDMSVMHYTHGEPDVTDRAIRLYNGTQSGGPRPTAPGAKAPSDSPPGPAAPPAEQPKKENNPQDKKK